MDFLTDVLSII